MYLPHQLLPPAGAAMAGSCVRRGPLPHATAVFDGPVRQFPFRDGSGTLPDPLRRRSHDAGLRQDWPRLENVAAQAEFRNQGMSVKRAIAPHRRLKVDAANVRFVDFKNGEMEVHAARARRCRRCARLPAATPLDAWRSTASRASRPAAPCNAPWTCSFRSSNSMQRRVLVHVDLHDATLKRRGATVAATDISGDRRHRRCSGRARRHARALLGGPFQMRRARRATGPACAPSWIFTAR